MKHSILFLFLSLAILAALARADENMPVIDDKTSEAQIIALLDSNDKKVVLAALEAIRERKIVAASEKVKTLVTDQDFEIRMAATKAFANSAPSTVRNIVFLLERLEQSWRAVGRMLPQEREHALREAILTLCRRTDTPDDVVNFFKTASLFKWVSAQDFYLDCLVQLGGEKAAVAIFEVAMKPHDAVPWREVYNEAFHDKATQLLGHWTTPEVAPLLLYLVEDHPNEKYRSRALRDYLRVTRQMNFPVEQKVTMAEKALAIAIRAGLPDADKEQATRTLERFRAMLKGKPIFDGKTFDGWEFRGNEEWFRIEDGAIVGGSREKPIPRNEFVVSKREYGDFTLRLESKAIGEGCNGGVQFRSVRAPADGNMPSEMIGYQADMTDNASYWGALYDESRRNRFLVEPPKELVERIFRPNDWNEYEIVCKGNNVKIFLNGTLTVDYTETEANIPQRGFIGLQIHGGPPSETWYRNIRIEE